MESQLMILRMANDSPLDDEVKSDLQVRCSQVAKLDRLQ